MSNHPAGATEYWDAAWSSTVTGSSSVHDHTELRVMDVNDRK